VDARAGVRRALFRGALFRGALFRGTFTPKPTIQVLADCCGVHLQSIACKADAFCLSSLPNFKAFPLCKRSSWQIAMLRGKLASGADRRAVLAVTPGPLTTPGHAVTGDLAKTIQQHSGLKASDTSMTPSLQGLKHLRPKMVP